MFKWNIHFLTTLCGLIAVANSASSPIRHYGHCNIHHDIGYCQHHSHCWEQNVNFNSRSRCSSQIHSDLVCCRRGPPIQLPITLRQLPQPGVCGSFTDSFSDRIIAGTQAGIEDFPWMALLRYTSDGEEYSHLCGGSLIHERWVLTAAHCVSGRDKDQELVQVRLGEWNTTSSPDCQQFKGDRVCAPPHIDVNIDRIIVHEQYEVVETENRNYAHDIALLRLNRTVTFTDFVLPICLPVGNLNEEYAYAGYAMDIAGWGNTEEIRFGGSPIKMMATLNALSTASCRQIYPQIVAGQMCAGGESPAGTCRGDSGGPLMLLAENGLGNSSYYLTGIVSLGTATCNNGGRPMVFTRVEHYMPWITGTISTNN